MNKKTAIFGLVFLSLVLTSQVTFALDFNIADDLGKVGELIEDLIQNSGFRFGLTFILMFVIFYAVIAAGLNKVEVFKGEDEQPNKLGKIIAVSMGLLATLGLTWYANFSGRLTTDRVLEYFGWFGAVAVGALMFAIGHYNTNVGDKDWRKTFTMVFFGLAAYCALLGFGGWFGTFITLSLILLALYLISISQAKDKTWTGLGAGAGPGAAGAGRNRPSRVQNFTATPQPGSVQLNWNANPAGENIQGYELQRVTPTRVAVPWTRRFRWHNRDQTWNLGANTTNHADNTASFAANPTLNYRIRARNQDGVGDWQYASVSVGTVTVTGLILSGDGHDIPIDNLNIQITGPSTHNAANPTGTGGEPPGVFHINNAAPLGGVAHNLVITDPHGLFIETHNHIINLNNAQNGNFYIGNGGGQPIRMLPQSGHTASVSLTLLTPTGTPYTGTPVQTYVSGGFGTQISNIVHPNAAGLITIPNIPAGYNVRVRIADLMGAYPIAVSNYVFLRVPGATENLGTIQFNASGTCQLSGIVQAWNYGIWIGLSNTDVDLSSPTNPHGGSNQSNSVGQYLIDNISADVNYTINAQHVPNHYVPINNPPATHYPIVGVQNLNIPMIPRSPPPSGVGAHFDASGRLVFTIRF